MADNADWNGFFSFWSYQSETAIWDPDVYCGHTWVNGQGGGHAVVIVGYNDDDADPANHYWIVLNSWGTTAGRLNGLFRMKMHMNYNCVMHQSGYADWYSRQFQTLNVTFNTSARAEITGTWSSGIWYYNVGNSTWTKMYSSSSVPSGPIAVGDVTGDGKADVISCWPSGLWYQNGATLGWTKVCDPAPDKVAAGDITGDGRAEIIGTWSNGIWYYNVATSTWTKMYSSSSVPSGPIAVGDVTGDGKADVISCWPSGLWYQNGATLGWTKVCDPAPDKVAAGDITGDGRAEIIGTWSNGIWYRNVATSTWTKMYSSSSVPSGPIAVGDVTGDGRADVISCWPSGLWYQNGATLEWTKVCDTALDKVAAGDITGN